MAASHTPNLNLNKPDRADNVNVITDINDNMDIIDSAHGAMVTKTDTIISDLGDAYDNTKTYLTNNICIHDNVLYRALVDITTPEDWTPAHWTVTTVAEAMQYAVGDVSVDYPFTIAVSDWSNTSPYTYTWTNAAIVDKVGVEVDFVSGAENGDIPYIYYEKVTGGVQFTSPIQPTADVPVVVHVINAEAESVTSITGSMVATSVIPNAANVDEALSELDDDITALNSNIGNLPNTLLSSYNSLVEPKSLTQTETTYNTYDSRKFSDYYVLFLTIIIEGYIREGVIIPRSVFTGYSGTGTSLNYNSGGVSIEVVVKYYSDTQVKMKYNASSNKSVTVRIDALALENK